jgi:hypothetical protein
MPPRSKHATRYQQGFYSGYEFSHDGRYLALAIDRRVEIWDTQTGTLDITLEPESVSGAWSGHSPSPMTTNPPLTRLRLPRRLFVAAKMTPVFLPGCGFTVGGANATRRC